MTTAIEPHLRPESEKAELRLGLELLSLKLCQTQPYILTALKESGLTVVPLATPSPETGGAPTAQPKSERAKALGLPCGGCGGNCGPGCTCDCHHDDTNLLPTPAVPAAEPGKPPETCACVGLGLVGGAGHVCARTSAATTAEPVKPPEREAKAWCDECGGYFVASSHGHFAPRRTPAAGTAPKGAKCLHNESHVRVCPCDKDCVCRDVSTTCGVLRESAFDDNCLDMATRRKP